MKTHRELFFQHLAQTTPFPLSLEIEKAEGVYLYSKDKKYTDLISGISVSNVGHRHPRVINAIKDQLDKYLHVMVYGEYIQAPQVKLAEKLASLLPSSLNCSYLVNSGAEAVEAAMKLAKRYTGKSNFITLNNAYHGSTQGALSLMGNESLKAAYRPLLPGIKKITPGNINELELIDKNVAAVFIEPFQGEAGIRSLTLDYLKKVRERCTETGTLLVFDEIQTGFGRTGKMFGFEHFNVIPDIILFAKGLGGGMPIGCMNTSDEIMQAFNHKPMLGHITTFGGHPVNCAAAIATLEVIEENKYHEVAEKLSQYMRSLLVHPAIKEIRGKGLLMALQFESFDQNKKIIDECIMHGVITDWFLFCDDAMRIAPPLSITEQEIKEACDVIIKSIEKVAGSISSLQD
jgi:acetylornithine/succinyldiaminopimelate/putrescine aminotransferase